LVLKREVLREGKSRAWVNGSPVTISVLSEIGGLLVDLHGQHETQSLLRADAQRDMLDAYADAAVERVAVRDAHARLRELEQREAAFASSAELAHAARAYAAEIEADPERLSAVEQRRDLLFRLQQKHGPTIADVLAARDSAARELELLDTADLDLRNIAAE